MKKTADVVERLAEKIVAGGSGVWGEIMMPAHPSISKNDATLMAEYILDITDQTLGTLPLTGTYTPKFPVSDNGQGSVIVRAAYQDRGAGDIPAHITEEVLILRAAALQAGDADVMERVQTAVSGRGAGPVNVMPTHGGYIGFKDVDLTGVATATITAQARSRSGTVGGDIEFRLGAPDGALLGRATIGLTAFPLWPSSDGYPGAADLADKLLQDRTTIRKICRQMVKLPTSRNVRSQTRLPHRAIKEVGEFVVAALRLRSFNSKKRPGDTIYTSSSVTLRFGRSIPCSPYRGLNSTNNRLSGCDRSERQVSGLKGCAGKAAYQRQRYIEWESLLMGCIL